MADFSPFTITPKEASLLLRENFVSEDNRNCYMLQVRLKPVYGAGPLPQSSFKKLPRLVNGIPLGAGKLPIERSPVVTWKYVEGCGETITFVSLPISLDQAEETRRHFKERLVKQAKPVFGDITVKASVVLSRCIHFDSDFFVNDIAEPKVQGGGLVFHDS
jgi:hypothetical protein